MESVEVGRQQDGLRSACQSTSLAIADLGTSTYAVGTCHTMYRWISFRVSLARLKASFESPVARKAIASSACLDPKPFANHINNHLTTIPTHILLIDKQITMSLEKEDGQSSLDTTQQVSRYSVQPYLYSGKNHHKFISSNSLGIFMDQRTEGDSSIKFPVLVTNTDIGENPAVIAALKDFGKPVVNVKPGGDIKAEWAKKGDDINKSFSEMSNKITDVAVDTLDGSLKFFSFANTKDHLSLLDDPSVKKYTTEPPPSGQTASNASGKRIPPTVASNGLATRTKHYEDSDSDDGHDLAESIQSDRSSSTGK